MSLKYLQDLTKWFINVAGKIGVKTFMKSELFPALNRCPPKKSMYEIKNCLHSFPFFFELQGVPS